MKISAHDSTSKSSSTKSVCSGILRRLLCSGCTLPTQTHPSLSDFEIQNPQHFITKPNHDVKAAPASTPGVVARLMGLDSFPNTSNDTPRHTTLGALLRSRSVNSIDFLLHFDPVQKEGLRQQHRRVRTAISFPQGLVINDEAALPEFDKVDKKTAGHDVKYQKREKGENFQEKRGAAKKVEIIGEVRNRSDVVRITSKKKDVQSTRPQVRIKPITSKKELDKDSKRVKKRKNKVLANKKKVYPQESIPDVARRRVYSRKPPVLSENGVFQEACETNNEKKMKQGDYVGRSRVVEEICRVTEEDIRENWDPKFEDFEEICQQFGQEILHTLLKQLVDELVLTREIHFLDCGLYRF